MATQNGGGPKSGTPDVGAEHRAKAFQQEIAASAAKRATGQRIPKPLLHQEAGMVANDKSANQRFTDNNAHLNQTRKSTRPGDDPKGPIPNKEFTDRIQSRVNQRGNHRELHNVNQAQASQGNGNKGP